MRQQPSVARLLASTAIAAILAVGLGGCQTMSDITGSISSKSDASPDPDPRRSAETYGERYRANPKDADSALKYGQALRATGQRTQAVAVLEQATIAHPGNKPMFSPAPIRPIIPIGESFRCKEPRSTNSAGTTKRAVITPAP